VNDDRISRYLQQQAEGIALPPADADGAMRRGARRKTRRRAALLGSVAVVGRLATTVAVRSGDDGGQEVHVASAPNARASSFHWSVVTPKTGLAYGGDNAQLADGSVYALSTAPGDDGTDGGASFASTLYRSSDGTEWSPVTLPGGIHQSGLAGGGDTLYSVGTSPAGGIVVGASSDGAQTWSTSDLAGDVAQLKAQYGDKVVLGPAQIAARDGSHVVVSILASTTTQLELFAPQYAGDGYEWTDSGVHVYELPDERCGGPASTLAADDANRDPAAARHDLVECRDGAKAAGGHTEGRTIADLTWDQLGITGALRDHVGGVAYTYVSDDGHTFEPVSLPSDLPAGAASQWMSRPIATADGYRLVLSGSDATTVLRSADGHSWALDTSFDGSYADAGSFLGAAAVSLYTNDGHQIVKVEGADGAWSDLDLVSAVHGADAATAYVSTVGFGPLGVAAVVGVADGDGSTEYIVHSSDAGTLQVERVADVVDGPGQVAGLVVTPDAIVARVVNPSDGDDSTPPTSRVLVGTPR
jgi:hypothetical protein